MNFIVRQLNQIYPLSSQRQLVIVCHKSMCTSFTVSLYNNISASSSATGHRNISTSSTVKHHHHKNICASSSMTGHKNSSTSSTVKHHHHKKICASSSMTGHKNSSTSSKVTHGHQCKVIVSKSDDIFTNLALEEWIYETEELTNQSFLLMWRNKPTVVIGRHQNPWLECNVNKLREDGVNLARRKSGGGCVYHDMGNLNCSFIKHKQRYNRKENLDLIVQAITSKWDINLCVNTREDIVLDGLYKVSGTASKLGKNKTYHHCTLLCDVDKEYLVTYLNSPMATIGIHSRATQSQKSWTRNLRDEAEDINFHTLLDVIGREFLRNEKLQSDFSWVDPGEEEIFPGLNKLKLALTQWDWVYGHTPKFSICRNYSVDLDGIHKLWINLEIEKGRISHLDMRVNSVTEMTEVINIIQQQLEGRKLSSCDLLKCVEDVDDLLSNVKVTSTPAYVWIIACLKKTICT